MSFDTIRINELAKELGMTSKEVIEKFAQISVTGKTHSSTVTVDQVKRLKDFIVNIQMEYRLIQLLRQEKILHDHMQYHLIE